MMVHKINALRAGLLFCLLLVAGVFSTRPADSMVQGRPGDTLVHGVPRMISRQFKFTEGPASDRHGNVFFTDQPNNKIWKYGTDGRLSVFMDTAGRANGMFFDPKGNLIACADEHDQLWSIAPDGKVTILVSAFQGKRLNGPNDVWVDPKGGIYFTDPYYQRDYWKRTRPDMKSQDVYYLAPGSGTPVRLETGLEKPNGIVGTADGKRLFVADIQAGKIYSFRIAGGGILRDKQVFVADRRTDGLTIDRKGNLYAAGKGVSIYNSQGTKIGQIAIDEPWTANICFGGKRDNELFITASTAIYVVKMPVRGIRP